MLRAQHFNRPGALAHFRLFGLCTAGRDEGSYRFEQRALTEQLTVYVRLLSDMRQRTTAIRGIRVAITDFEQGHHDQLRTTVLEPLASQFPDVQFAFDPTRTTGRDYYEQVCFYIYTTDDAGSDIVRADGGFTTWTQHFLSNKKEHLLISGIGSERVPGVVVRTGHAT